MSSDRWEEIPHRNQDAQQPRNNEDDEFGEFEGFEAARQFYENHPEMPENPDGDGNGTGVVQPWGPFPDYVPNQRAASSATLQPDLLPTQAGVHASCPMTDSGGSIGSSCTVSGLDLPSNNNHRVDDASGGGDNPSVDDDQQVARDRPRAHSAMLPDVSSRSDFASRGGSRAPSDMRGEWNAAIAPVGGARTRQTPPLAPSASATNGYRTCNGAGGPGSPDSHNMIAPFSGEPRDDVASHRRLAREVDALHHQVAELVHQLQQLSAERHESEDAWQMRESRHVELRQQLSQLERRQASTTSAASPNVLTEERMQTMLRESAEQQRALMDERLASYGVSVVQQVQEAMKVVVERGTRDQSVEPVSTAVRDMLNKFAEEQKRSEEDRWKRVALCTDAILEGARQQIAALLQPDS